MARLRALPSLVPSLAPVLQPPPKIADQFYLSPEWRALIGRIKRDRGSRCERCGSGHRVIGDHKVEIKDGGARLDAQNVQLLCQACHNSKTAAARRARASTPT